MPFARTLTVLCLLLPAMAGAAETKHQERERQFQSKIQPLVVKYCFECHGNGNSEGDFNLDKYTSVQKMLEGRKNWLKVQRRMVNADMPPKDADVKPTKEEYALIAEFLGPALNDIDCTGTPIAGHVTLRRLTRYEYRNTVRDLIGIDYEPASSFPADEVGYGFDNIGDVLSLPPILLEKYLAAAEEITAKAIVTAPPEPKTVLDVSGRRLQATGSASKGDKGVQVLASSGELFTDFNLDKEGEYLIRVKAYADQAGDEPAKMGLKIDGQDTQTFEVKNEGELANFERKQKLASGRRKISLGFLNDFYNPEAADPKKRDRNLIIGRLEVIGPLDQKVDNRTLTHKKLITATPDDKTSWAEAARKVMKPIASRAFRRPVTEGELDRLVQISQLAQQNNDNYETGIQLAISAVLVSPNFLFKVEASPDPNVSSDAVRTLTDFELATRLSYFLWSSLPDDELFKLALDNKLREGDTLEKQVKRMLADPRSQALVDNFAGQWLTLRNLDTVQPNGRRFRQWNPVLRAAMRKETELFIGALVREDQSLMRVLDADFTFVNEPLAQLYGIADVKGNDFRRVSLTGTNRGGLLTQASILTVTSNPGRTSPVKRGKWILENLLNEPPPPPPPGVPELEKQTALRGTLREQMQQHRENPTCKSCHEVMDSLGFALENYDAIGAFREKDAGLPVDATGEFPSGEKFTGAAELRQLLLNTKQKQFVDCVTEKMLTYALGRGLEYYDQCVVTDISQKLAKNDHRFSTLIVEIVRSYPFQHQGVKRSE